MITVNCALSAAGNLKQIGKIGEAAILFRDCLTVMETKLGADHPDTIDCLFGLAGALDTQTDAKEAIELAERICILTKQVYGPHHEKSVKAKHELDRIVSLNPSNENPEHHPRNKDAEDKHDFPNQQRQFNMKEHDDKEIPVWKDPDYEASLAYAKGIAKHIGRGEVGLDIFLLGTWMAYTNEKLIEDVSLDQTQRPVLLSISEDVAEEERVTVRDNGDKIIPYHGTDFPIAKRLKQLLAKERHASFIHFIDVLFDEVSSNIPKSPGKNQWEELLNYKSSDGDHPSEEPSDSFRIGVQQEMNMWDTFSRVLNLGEEWANEEGKGEWRFSTGTKISVDFNSLDTLDDLEAILDIFEDATDEDKDALRRSLEKEGQVSHFCFTVTTPSKQEYYFHQLTGGGGEPVVEDFYCDEENKIEIHNALNEVINAGEPPSQDNGDIKTMSYPDAASIEAKIINFISNSNDMGWFTDDNCESHTLPDETILSAELHEYDDPRAFLEEYDEMRLWKDDEYEGHSYDSSEVEEILSENDNMLMFEFTLDLSKPLSITDGRVIYKFIQWGEGLEIGGDIWISPDIERVELNSWLDNAISNGWKV